MWKGIVGSGFDPEGFEDYCGTLRWDSWTPEFIVLHNTAVPSLDQRPVGFTAEHMRSLESYYRYRQRWNAGPHLFVDDSQIWVFTPLTVTGTHSPSWNGVALGVEMLGDYTVEAFDSGRGARVRDNAVAAIASLSRVLDLDPASMMLHKEDKRTSHRNCPGRNVDKQDFIARVSALI